MNNFNQLPRPNNGFNQLFTFFGIGCAFIFALGVMKRSGMEIIFNETTTSVSKASMLPNLTGEAEENLTINEVAPLMPVATAQQTTTTSTIKKTTKLNLEHWVNQYSAIAQAQALEQGIPAALTLAIGINHLQKGGQIQDAKTFQQAIIQPLLSEKLNASKAHRSMYYKYAANSQMWATGLDRADRYAEATLMNIINQFNLHIFDEAVRKEIIGRTSTDKAVELKITTVAKKVVAEQKVANTATLANMDVAIAEKAQRMDAKYNQLVGHDVAKAIAKKELQSGHYITEEDMKLLVEETNTKTGEVLENKLMFMGRTINREHPEADKMLDITNPKNGQARGELYLQKVKKQ